jgi:hypothetical protein
MSFFLEYTKRPAALLPVVPGETDISSTMFLKQKIINFVKKDKLGQSRGYRHKYCSDLLF